MISNIARLKPMELSRRSNNSADTFATHETVIISRFDLTQRNLEHGHLDHPMVSQGLFAGM